MSQRTKPPREDKVKVTNTLEALISNSGAVILTDYRGMTMKEVSNLRNKLRASGGEYHVVKNTLYRRAMGDKLTPELEQLLHGPTAIAFAKEDPVATTKVLLDFLKDLRKEEIKVKGGLVSGKVFTPAQVTALSKLPAKEVILAQAVGSIQSPLSAFAGTMNGVLGEFARTLQALADKRTAEGA